MIKTNTYFLLSPIPFFALGFFYYLILPYFVLTYLNVYELTPVEAVLPFMDKSFFTLTYFVDISLIFISFIFGYKLSLCFLTKKTSSQFDQYSNSTNLSKIFFGIIVVFNLILVSNFKNKGGILFSGYQGFDISFLGQLSTITFLSFFFLNYFQEKSSKIMFFLLILFESSILLGLGSRNIVMNGTITGLLGLLYFNKKLLFSIKFYAFICTFGVLILFIGVWRTGFELGINTILGILFAEPVFVISSASLYLENLVTRPFINFPQEIFISVINFIPTFIYPGKVGLINSFMSDIQHFSPFGASSVLVNLYSNFGYFYFVYIILVGAFFGYIYKKSLNSVFYRSIYFSAVPMIVFQFYNQFLYSFFKLLIWNAVLVPILIFYIVSQITKRLTR